MCPMCILQHQWPNLQSPHRLGMQKKTVHICTGATFCLSMCLPLASPADEMSIYFRVDEWCFLSQETVVGSKEVLMQHTFPPWKFPKKTQTLILSFLYNRELGVSESMVNDIKLLLAWFTSCFCFMQHFSTLVLKVFYNASWYPYAHYTGGEPKEQREEIRSPSRPVAELGTELQLLVSKHSDLFMLQKPIVFSKHLTRPCISRR